MATIITKNELEDAAWKLAKVIKGGVIGYYASKSAAQILSQDLPEEIVKVVSKHVKVNLTASLTQSIIPGASIAASAAMVASIWKMYYDINQVLGIKISENVGKSLTSSILTNMASAGAHGLATAVSEGAKFIPFVGWLASAGISAASSTAIIYGAAYCYINLITRMYESEGEFDESFLTGESSSEYVNEASYDEGDYTQYDGTYNDQDEDEETRAEQLYAYYHEQEQDRLKAFLTSYSKGEYSYWSLDKLTEMFEREAETSSFIDVTCDFYYLSAESRLAYYIEEWIDNDFKNYHNGNDKHELQELVQKCIVNGKEIINICTNSFPDEKKYKYMAGLFNMLEDYWSHSIYEEDRFKSEYSNLPKILKSATNCIFKKDYLLDIYNRSIIQISNEIRSLNREVLSHTDLPKVPIQSNTGHNNELNGQNCENNKQEISTNEQEYINELKDILVDGEISSRERKLLNKIRTQLDISEARAAELEEMISKPSLSDSELEYLKEYKEIIAEGEISARDQRYLDKLKQVNGISEDRAKEIEAMA